MAVGPGERRHDREAVLSDDVDLRIAHRGAGVDGLNKDIVARVHALLRQYSKVRDENEPRVGNPRGLLLFRVVLGDLEIEQPVPQPALCLPREVVVEVEREVLHLARRELLQRSHLLDDGGNVLQAEILVAAEADVLHVAVGLSDEVVHLVGDDASDLELHRVEVICIQGKLSFTGHGEEGSLVHDLHFLGNLRYLDDLRLGGLDHVAAERLDLALYFQVHEPAGGSLEGEADLFPEVPFDRHGRQIERRGKGKHRCIHLGGMPRIVLLRLDSGRCRPVLGEEGNDHGPGDIVRLQPEVGAHHEHFPVFEAFTAHEPCRDVLDNRVVVLPGDGDRAFQARGEWFTAARGRDGPLDLQVFLVGLLRHRDGLGDDVGGGEILVPSDGKWPRQLDRFHQVLCADGMGKAYRGGDPLDFGVGRVDIELRIQEPADEPGSMKRYRGRLKLHLARKKRRIELDRVPGAGEPICLGKKHERLVIAPDPLPFQVRGNAQPLCDFLSDELDPGRRGPESNRERRDSGVFRELPRFRVGRDHADAVLAARAENHREKDGGKRNDRQNEARDQVGAARRSDCVQQIPQGAPDRARQFPQERLHRGKKILQEALNCDEHTFHIDLTLGMPLRAGVRTVLYIM